jgi:SAM-dependent methyltransferase
VADAGARRSPEPSPPARRTPRVDDFLVEPTRELDDWHWLWKEDREFPIRSHRGLLGRVLVAWKRLLRPLVKVPQNDLWERQRIFNVVLLEHLRDERQLRHRDGERIAYLEALNAEGIEELMRHNDALFARADQKLDRYRREARDLLASLGATLARAESAAPTAAAGQEDLSRRYEEHAYFELERRYRGTEEEIRGRIASYLPYLAAGGPALDLGCGRGEALALLAEHGIAARGVDGSARMVAMCRERGLDAVQGDLFAALAAAPPASLGAVLSFHVVEHLPIGALDRLVRLAWGALRPGGVLILETPSPLSLVVGARKFWLDPTHARPVHPESLRLLYELAGFDPVERLDLRPFPAAERLPEIELSRLPPEQRVLADAVNRLRDHLDDLLYGCQDFALIGVKPVAAGDP